MEIRIAYFPPYTSKWNPIKLQYFLILLVLYDVV
ncbi:MAG TPA: hypothetical protein EYQ43_10905 [Methyloprofundus sp.]|nr:hypothetical protein [Methyloprofundus sp.]HIL79439.1 hypothetical protein [Methylococcales bacterium]